MPHFNSLRMSFKPADIPVAQAAVVLEAGKHLAAIRECGRRVDRPLPDDVRIGVLALLLAEATQGHARRSGHTHACMISRRSVR